MHYCEQKAVDYSCSYHIKVEKYSITFSDAITNNISEEQDEIN